MHPLVQDLSELKDAELDSRISDLTKKYFMTSNSGVREQMVAILESYKAESSKRRQAAWEKMMSNRDKSLDKLINIS
jgi:hypothetical protein